ncbi:MAG: NFACT RNA binding domain-containing protein [Chlorobiota bacterium]
MINHKATISALSHELTIAIGYEIVEIYQQHKGVIIVRLENESDTIFLEFSNNQPYDRLFARAEHKRAKANTIDLFQFLLGQTITNVVQVNEDRVLCISTQSYLLFFKLFGHNQSDLIVTNHSQKIVATYSNTEQVESQFELEEKQPTLPVDMPDETKVEKAIRSSSYYLGRHYTNDFLQKNSIEKDITLGKIDKKELTEKLTEYYLQLARSTKSYVYKITENDYLMSLTQLRDYELHQRFDTVSEGIRTKFVREISRKSLIELQKKANTILSRIISKDEKAIKRIELLDDGVEKSDKYRHFAELMLSQPNPKQKYGNKVDLKDWDGSSITIPLDEKLDLVDNAQKYFKKSSSILKERKIAKQKLPEIKDNLDLVTRIKSEIDEADNVKTVEDIITENKAIFGSIMNKSNKEEREDKFKKFELSENYTLYVGKNAKNNDELTLRFAKPNDIWLHARGVGGSHCVIRVDGRKPSKGIIKEASAIAAFYSKAKSSKLAPVAYTEKKYVSKPKGANPGAVVVRREDVVMVEPRLPE